MYLNLFKCNASILGNFLTRSLYTNLVVKEYLSIKGHLLVASCLLQHCSQ